MQSFTGSCKHLVNWGKMDEYRILGYTWLKEKLARSDGDDGKYEWQRLVTWRKHVHVSWISSRQCHLLVFMMHMLSLVVAKQGKEMHLACHGSNNIHTIQTLSNQKVSCTISRGSLTRGKVYALSFDKDKHDYTKHDTYITQLCLLWTWLHADVHAFTCSVTTILHMRWASLSFHSQKISFCTYTLTWIDDA